MINRVILVGRITKDPELRFTPTNVPVVQFTIAVNRIFTDGQGEKQTDFISCVVWRKQAENLARFVKKGALIGVEGRIQTRNYEASDNTTRYVTEVLCDSIQFLESANRNETQTQGYQSNNDYASNNNTYNKNNNYGNNSYANNGNYGNNNYGFNNTGANNNAFNNRNEHSNEEDTYLKSNKNLEVSEEDLPF